MKVWTITGFEGYYPVGTAAVVVADTTEMAATLLNVELQFMKLPPSAKAEHFQQLTTNNAAVRILCDGNY